MTDTTLTYEKAYAELDEIAKALESETILLMSVLKRLNGANAA